MSTFLKKDSYTNYYSKVINGNKVDVRAGGLDKNFGFTVNNSENISKVNDIGILIFVKKALLHYLLTANPDEINITSTDINKDKEIKKYKVYKYIANNLPINYKLIDNMDLIKELPKFMHEFILPKMIIRKIY